MTRKTPYKTGAHETLALVRMSQALAWELDRAHALLVRLNGRDAARLVRFFVDGEGAGSRLPPRSNIVRRFSIVLDFYGRAKGELDLVHHELASRLSGNPAGGLPHPDSIDLHLAA
jgi:hypothetical protein